MSDRRVSNLTDVGEVSTVARAAPSATTTLVRRVGVIEGPDAGTTFSLDANSPSRILLGTSPACQLRLTDPSVSRRHLAIEMAGQRLRILDLDSTNGSFLDGTAIVEAFAHGGEVLRCGGTAMLLEALELSVEASTLPNAMRFGNVIGASLAMRRLYPLCERLAASDVPVIIEGETGTGKENLAESLHEVGKKDAPFIVFDCTAVSPTLVEAELFGHERGAFTGAVAPRAGVFEEANGGTLLIDEIGDLDLALQAKLLRVIDRGELRRVGGRSVRVNVRILAATRRDLDKEVTAGRFRDDLFHRLAVARIELPPLRERIGDVPILARAFALALGAEGDALSADWLARLSDYRWPGNVRELKNAVTRFLTLGEGQVPKGPSIRPAASLGGGDWLDDLTGGKIPFPIARRRAIEEFERRYTQSVLATHNGSVSRAARASGIALRYFQLIKARGSKD